MFLGYVGSMPVAGPIALLVLGRGLENRSRNGLSLAFGAAIAESLYAYLAFWGFGAVLARYPWVEETTRFGVAVLLIALGLHFARRQLSKASTSSSMPKNSGNKRNFLLGFAITLLNPTLIATWTFTVTTVYSLGLVTFDATNAVPFSLGALAGIVSWFATMLYLLKRFRSSFPRISLQRTVKLVGIVLIVLGVSLGVVATRPYVAQLFG